MKAVFSLLAVAMSVSAFAQLELTPPVVGPFSIKGHKLWSFGPLTNREEFTIPASDPYNRGYILTGAVASGTPSIDCYIGNDQWTEVILFSPNAQFFHGFPRPGILLPPGRYRISGQSAPAMAFGYLAPQTTFPMYSGMDEYPPLSKIFSANSAIPGRAEFEVPQDKVYVVTAMYGLGSGVTLRRDVSGSGNSIFAATANQFHFPDFDCRQGDIR